MQGALICAGISKLILKTTKNGITKQLEENFGYWVMRWGGKRQKHGRLPLSALGEGNLNSLSLSKLSGFLAAQKQ